MKRITILLCLLVLSLNLFAHPWKPSHYVIIDTDGGIDDMRAISMLLASNDVKIMGIIVSGGALSPYDGYKKVKSMLNAYHHNGIPVAMDYNIRGLDMPVPLSLSWGEEEGLSVPETNGFNKLCKNLCKYSEEKFTYIALGSLNSIAELVNGEVVPLDRIKQIVWSNEALNRLNGFNAALDNRSANRIVKGDIPLVTVGYPAGEFYSDEFIAELARVGKRYSNKIYEVIKANPDLGNHSFALSAADEMVALYLFKPDLFTGSQHRKHTFMKPGSTRDLQASALKMLGGGINRGLQVMKALPSDTSFYQPDLQPFIADIIKNHGQQEWEAGVLANEMHRHLGIYSLIGVKMGIMAREYFDAGLDEFEIRSNAGLAPPLSCMNDGLQVSTGATLGHGLIKINETTPAPSAEFIHYGYRIRISLKADIALSINEELKELVIVNGLDSDIYWELVRQRALLHWKNLSRHEIFEVEVLD